MNDKPKKRRKSHRWMALVERFPDEVAIGDVSYTSMGATVILTDVRCKPGGAARPWGNGVIRRYVAWSGGAPVDSFDLFPATPKCPTWHAWTGDAANPMRAAIRAAVGRHLNGGAHER